MTDIFITHTEKREHCYFLHPRVSIKFELGSWLEKNNRLHEQGPVRHLNLGGVWGHAPSENFEIWKL